jgi:hypothetical protein
MLESLVVSLFCITLVFFVLSSLFILIKVLSMLLTGIGHKRTGIAAVENRTGISADEADVSGISAGELKLIGVDEKTAAMIMAIVSHESRIPLSELSFKSIKAVEGP